MQTAALPLPLTIGLLVALTVAELIAPVVVERRFGRAPWNAGHIAERFSLLTLITLGEVVVVALAASCAVVEVVGHEAVGYKHTVRALERGRRVRPY